MFNRVAREADPRLTPKSFEIEVLGNRPPSQPAVDVLGRHRLADYVTRLARPGSYLARAGDPATDNIVMRRSLTRMIDTLLGIGITKVMVCN